MTIEEQLIREISVGELLDEVRNKSGDGYRLVQIGCTRIEDAFEINYSFDKENRFENLRVTIGEDVTMPSISDIYWGAFIYENEMHDLYGIPVEGMNLDFKGNLIRTSVPHPFRGDPGEVKVKKVPVKKAEKAETKEAKKEEATADTGGEE